MINKKLLPIKGHYLFFNAGTAPLVPYLSTYARQLGFSSGTVGLIYTILPICGLIVKPLFGVIADRFRIQKIIFILFQIITIVSFSAIYFIPENRPQVTVELDCGDGATVLKSCFRAEDEIDTCKVNTLASDSDAALCNMNCDMTSPNMWQTVCEHWHLPQYCYNNTDNIQYTSYIKAVTLQSDSCAYISASNVTLDGLMYQPQCQIRDDYIDINEPCQLNCTNQYLSSALLGKRANMTCLDKLLNYRLCSNDTALLNNLTQQSVDGSCEASCSLDHQAPWRLMEICEGWGADAAASCKPKTKLGQEFPSNLSFVASILPSSAFQLRECVYIRLNHLEMPDGTTIYPNCIPKPQYQNQTKLFYSSCEISCNNSLANELFQEANENTEDSTTQYTRQFWLFFLLMIVSWIGQAVVVTFADAICLNLLGTDASHYGKQRMWGSVGFGIVSLTTGALIDSFSEGAYKDYTIAFVLMFIFMVGDVAVSCFLRIEFTKMSVSIMADVGTLLSSIPTAVFMAWTIAVGICTGLVWQFLFWHIEDIARDSCGGNDYTKTLQGLVSAIQTFCGEMPFLFVSGYILRKVGHINMMSLVLFAFGCRFLLYSCVTNPWWILPIELLQGITFGMFYPTMTLYANIVSPTGTETTVQGLVGAIFEGVGTSLGSYIGGQLYAAYGGWNTFLYFGIGALVCCILHIVAQYFMKNIYGEFGLNQGYTSVQYKQPNDKIHILEDMGS